MGLDQWKKLDHLYYILSLWISCKTKQPNMRT